MKSSNQNKLFFELCSKNSCSKEKEAIILILDTEVSIDNLLKVLNDTN